MINQIINDMTIQSTTSERAILEAAEHEFMTKGYDGAKTQAIAKEAGVTHAMLHYYFRTKENLFDRVFKEKTGIMMQSIISAFKDSQGTFIERLQKGIEAHFDFLAKNPDLPRFVINELISKPERADMLKSRVKDVAGNIASKLNQEISELVKQCKINDIKIIDLLLDIGSLNLFVFIAYPIISNFTGFFYKSEEEFLEARKKETVRIITNRLLNKEYSL